MNWVLPLTLLAFTGLCWRTAGLVRALSLQRSAVFLFITALSTALFYGAYRMLGEPLVLGALAKMMGEANYVFLGFFIRSQRKAMPRSSEVGSGAVVWLWSLIHLTLNMTLTGVAQMVVMTVQVVVVIAWVASEAWLLWRSQRSAMSLSLAAVITAHGVSELVARSAMLWRGFEGSLALNAPGWTDAMLDWMWVTFFLGFMAQLATAGVVTSALSQDKARLEQMVSQVEEMLQEKMAMVMSLLASNAARETEPQLASLAHELRQPLGAIQLNAEYLASAQRMSREEESQVLQDILRDNQRAVTIVQGVRNLFVQQSAQLSRLNVSDALERWVAQQAKVLQPVGVRLTLNLTSQAEEWVSANVVQLEMVLQNLVNNATEELSLQGGGDVVITLMAQDRLVHVDVVDSGPGIPVEMHEKVFEMSFSTKSHGMGMGLWLSRRIAQMHRGHLGCVAKAQGTCMRLTLPREAV
jgi:signal transduction histidine kinase